MTGGKVFNQDGSYISVAEKTIDYLTMREAVSMDALTEEGVSTRGIGGASTTETVLLELLNFLHELVRLSVIMKSHGKKSEKHGKLTLDAAKKMRESNLNI